MENHLGSQDMMHGSIFVLLKRYVESNYDYSTWTKLLEKAGVDNSNYLMNEMYPTDDLFAIVGQASEATGIPMYELMEIFGEFMVPDLLWVYRKYLDPQWHTYEMLLYTEEKMHGAVREQDKRTTPPRLTVTKYGNNRLLVDYYSKRRMAGVAVGIIRGIAKYYNEADKVQVTRLSEPHAEEVKILVNFLD